MSAKAECYLLVLVFEIFILLLLAEKWKPHQKLAKQHLWQSFQTNASAFLFNNLVMNALSMSSLLLVAQKYAHYGLLSGLHDTPLKWTLCFVLLDLAVYGWHYIGHKSDTLWRLHKIHHSDKVLHVTTGLRFHVFDQMLEAIVKGLCIVAIGVEARVVILCEIARMLFVLFHHANVTVPGEKWLSRIIITPSLHRVHHSTRRLEHDSNYGIVLAVWDIIFLTRKEMLPWKYGLEVLEARNLLQLFSLVFVTERRFASVLHLLPTNEAGYAERLARDVRGVYGAPVGKMLHSTESLPQ